MRLTHRLAALVIVGAAVGLSAVTGSSTAAAAPASHAIEMMDFAFAPAAMTIAVGDTVVWTNHDTAQHDVLVTSGPETVHSPMLAKGASWSHTFTAAGSYRYVCSVHPDMVAALTVSAPAASSTPTSARSSASPGPATTSNAAIGPVAARSSASPAIHPSSPAVSRRASTTHPASSAPATTPAASTVSASSTQTKRLKPLLIVTGIVAAVATFCLLLLASRPDESSG